tara:strand:+ start:154 stop:393 length:240 start_codon:yes stop_codon:yes gene_type:complete
MKRILLIAAVLGFILPAYGQRVKYRKTQEVNFDGVDVDGVARSPDAAYLTQRRGIKFMPMYKVRKRFDDEIKKSVDYLR